MTSLGLHSSQRRRVVFGARHRCVCQTTWAVFETLEAGNGLDASNLPEGLTAQIERLSDTRIGRRPPRPARPIDQRVVRRVLAERRRRRHVPFSVLDFAAITYGIEYVDVDPSEGIAIANPGNNWKYFSWDVGDAEFGLWYINDHFRRDLFQVGRLQCRTNLAALQEGDTIQTSSNWEYFSELETQLVITSPTYSDWNGQTLYAGVKFTIAERFHYGWMRFGCGRPVRGVARLRLQPQAG